MRQFDIIVFGGTGFTGYRVAKLLHTLADQNNVTFAIGVRNVAAGRKLFPDVWSAVYQNRIVCEFVSEHDSPFRFVSHPFKMNDAE